MSRITRTRRSADQWRALISEQADSGLSQSAFCNRKQIALSTFTNWKRRLAGQAAATGESDDESVSSPWIELGAVGGSQPGWDIELDLGDGVCLRLRRG